VSANRPSDRTFGLVFAGLFGMIALIGWRLSGQIPVWAIGVAGALLVVAMLMPGLLLPLNRLWTYLGGRIGIVVNHVLLGSFFYVVVLPVGLFSRFMAEPMTKRPDPTVESYWTPVKRQATAETYRDLF
jgi:hypothetical protein